MKKQHFAILLAALALSSCGQRSDATKDNLEYAFRMDFRQ